MIHSQTIVGFFGNIAEAQQAVQRLLEQGFTRKTIELLTLSGLHRPSGAEDTNTNRSSGRFLHSLFGNQTEVSGRGLATIAVQSQSNWEGNKVANLLYEAGADDVLVEECLD